MNDIMDRPEYSFLHTEDKLKDNIVYLTLGGSHAYGTNVATSDIDVRGSYIESKASIYGIIDEKGEYEEKETDTVLYSLRKYIKLLISCNPNVIESLGTKKEHILYINEIGQALRDNAELFLSKRAYVTFAGYATSQLRRLENALARDSYEQSEKEKHILKSLNAEMLMAGQSFTEYDKNSRFHLYIDESEHEDMDNEIFVDTTLNHVPLRDYVRINSSFANMLRNYGKLNHRNRKKDELHLNKHAMHLIRLYFMGIDILKNHAIVTYRENEHDLLMSIRKGEMSYKDVFAMQKELEAALDKAYADSTLPDKPDIQKINDFVVGLYTKYL